MFGGSQTVTGEKIKTGCNCVVCKKGHVIAQVFREYSSRKGDDTPPLISLTFACNRCGIQYKFPPNKPELENILLEQVRKKDKERADKKWRETAGFTGKQEPTKVRRVNLKPGQYLDTKGKVRKQ